MRTNENYKQAQQNLFLDNETQNEVLIAYSTQTDNLPVTSLKINNNRPCMDPYQEFRTED
jgi:hypothetical protein